jgi:acetolactate synthase I/II/III large subunit
MPGDGRTKASVQNTANVRLGHRRCGPARRLARSCGVEGVRIDRAGDLGDAVKTAIASGKPYLIDANIGADLNPGGAGVWELPGLGRSRPLIGGRYEP